MGYLKLILILCLADLISCQVSDRNSNVCVKPTSSVTSKSGDYGGICVDKAVFTNQDHAFNFKSAYIRSTSFIGSRFADDGKTIVKLVYAFWENVTFSNCQFEGAGIIFEQALMAGVKFESCVFKSRPIFRQITMSDTTFSGCTFAAGATFENADLTTVSISSGSFQGPETLFDRSAIHGLTIASSAFASARFQYVNADKVKLQSVTMESFNCHEPLGSGQFVTKRAEFNSTSMIDTNFTKVSCDQTIWRNPVFDRMNFGDGVMDFSRSNMSGVTFSRLGNIKKSDCAQLDFHNSPIFSGVLSDIQTCKVDLSSANASGTDISGLLGLGSAVNLKNTIFTTPKFSNGDCCTTVCKKAGCICNVPAVTTDGCKAGSRKVNPNVKGSCFPSHATVALESGETKRMDQLAVGERVLSAPGVYSDVYMFAHHLPSAEALFLSLDTAAGVSLSLTSGHYIYLSHRADTSPVLAPASSAIPHVSRVLLANGSTALVTGARFSRSTGVYNPQTVHGDIVVNGVVASTYTTAVAPAVAHGLLAPLRTLYRVLVLPVATWSTDVQKQSMSLMQSGTVP
jgi:uncharacterized protein YjbI with pentapeptide repeats